MKFRWSISPAQTIAAKNLSASLQISPLLAQCLLNRHQSDSESIVRFLQPRLKNLADPYLLPNMDVAVDRLLRARENGEAMVIFGDYDVDGVTSTALLFEVLTRLGWKVNFYLPHRMDEGYGLSQDGVENCLKKYPTTFFLAVDCGSTAVTQIKWLRERGIDVIVLDHHQVSSPAPEAIALVNPQLSVRGGHSETSENKAEGGDHGASGGAFTELCSVGLAFKLAHAILKRLREKNDPASMTLDLRDYLDLVALGTIADLVPLTGENRILVTAGLEKLDATQRPGIVALKEVAECPSPLGCYEVGFQLGPRLNASGRLETAEQSLHLLLAKTVAEAEPLARNLDACNRERQKIERGISEEIIKTVRSRFNATEHFAIVEGHLNWHIGVVGIVASRVLQEFYRPTIIVGGDGDNWRGSGRSIEGFDLAAALRECSDLLVKHGGHAMAAGLTISPDKIDAFRARFNEIARAAIKPGQLQPILNLDAEVALADMTIERLEELEKLGPTGQGNPAVKFAIRNLFHQQPPQRMGKENQHVKLRVTDGRKMVEAVWWNAGDAELPKVMFDLAFSPQINEFNGRRSVQLKLLDWAPCAA